MSEPLNQRQFGIGYTDVIETCTINSKWGDFPLIPIMMPNENALKVLRGQIDSVSGSE